MANSQQTHINSQVLWQVVKSRINPDLSRLLLTGGLISTVVGLVMIFMLARLNSSTQDIRSQATQSDLKALLTLQTPDSIQVGDNTSLILAIQTTPNTQIDGIQLAILVPKVFFQTPIIALIPETGLNLAYQTITEEANNYLIKVIIIGQNINQPLAFTQITPLLKIVAVAKQSGQTELILNNQLSLATLFHTQPTQNVLEANLGRIMITDATAPTPTIGLTPTVTPNPNPTSIPTTNPLLPSLKFSFKLQGVGRANVVTNALVTISNLTVSEPAQPIQVAFKSNSAGIFWPVQPIAVNHLVLDGQTKYQVSVKTPISLRKNLDQISLTATPNQTPSSWQVQELMVGDFIQTGDNANKIDISDIGWMFSRYNQLSVEAIGELKNLDVNYDGNFDISDLGIVLSNYTQLELNGE